MMEKNNEQSKPKRRYKKRTKKVTPSTEGLSTDAPKETREIPMYDPYTGEPNPRYEELTGKPNPLLPPKRITMDNVAEESRTFMTNNSIEYKPETEFLDIKTNNRFLVEFPKELGIKRTHVQSVIRPSLILKRRGILGTKTEITPVFIELIDLIEEDFQLNDTLNEIFSNLKRFNLRIETVNPKGVVVEVMILSGCLIEEINFSKLSYNDDSLSVTTIKIQPRDYSII